MSQRFVVRPAGPADRAVWDTYVSARPEGDPLQTWAWGEASRVVGETPLRLLARRGDDDVVGLAQMLVRPTVVGRSVAYAPHGPLWTREAEDAADLLGALLDAMRSVAREERVIVVKFDPRATDAAPSAALAEALAGVQDQRAVRRARFDLQAPSTRIVALADGDAALWATWSPEARNLVRRSEREGVEVSVDRSGDEATLAAFADLLAATARRAGFRARSRAFLDALAAELAPRSSWLAALARWHGQPIAGVVTPRVGRRAYYLYGASRRDPAVRHTYGAYAALAAAMRALAEDGVRDLDMWGVVESEDATEHPGWEGFSFFKRRFGGRPLRHPGTFDLVVDPFWYLVRDLRERLGAALSSKPRW